MSPITLAQRFHYMTSILTDQAFLDCLLGSWPFQDRQRYNTTVLQPIAEKLQAHDSAVHTPEENLAFLTTVIQLHDTLRTQNGLKSEFVQPLDRLFWPQDWRPDDSILEMYLYRNRFQKRMALSSLPQDSVAAFVHVPFDCSLARLIPDALQEDLLTFQSVLSRQRFNAAVNYVERYPTAAYSEQSLKSGTIVNNAHVHLMMKNYAALTQFVNHHFFQDGFVDEFTHDCSELAKLCNPTAFILVAKAFDDQWCMILDEQACALTKLIFKKILEPIYFNSTFLDGPPGRAIAFLSQLQKELTNNFRQFQNDGHIEGYYHSQHSGLLQTFITEFIDQLTRPAFIKKLSKFSSAHPEWPTIKILLKTAEHKKQFATLRMTTLLLLQGQRQSDHVLSRTPKDMIRMIAGLTAGDKLDEQARSTAIAEAEAFNSARNPRQSTASKKSAETTTLHQDIMKRINGFKAYRARIDRWESKSDPEAKFRHFIFPIGKESRAKNRKINYQISEKITTQLETLLKSKRDLKRDDVDLVFKKFHRKGLYLTYTDSSRSKPHVIRSREMNSLIKLM